MHDLVCRELGVDVAKRQREQLHLQVLRIGSGSNEFTYCRVFGVRLKSNSKPVALVCRQGRDLG